MVRNYRVRGKHRQEVLCHIGPHDSLERAIEEAKEKISNASRKAAKFRQLVEYTQENIRRNYREEFGSELPTKEVTEKRCAELIEERHKIEKSSDYNDFEFNRWLRQYRAYGQLHTWYLGIEILHREERLANKYRARLAKMLEIQKKYF